MNIFSISSWASSESPWTSEIIASSVPVRDVKSAMEVMAYVLKATYSRSSGRRSDEGPFGCHYQTSHGLEAENGWRMWDCIGG